MKKTISILLACALMCGLAACGGGSSPATPPAASAAEPAERTEPLVLRFGATGSGRDDDVQWVSNSRVIEAIEKETNGMIKIEYYPSETLGTASSMLEQVIMGTLDMTVVQPNIASLVWPEFNVLVFPFAYPDQETYWDAMLSDGMFDKFREVTSKDNKAVYLGVCSSSYRGCQNTEHPIRQASDFKGLTFRVMPGQIYADIFNALGASTTTISASEVYTALQQGVINAEEGPPSYSYDLGYHEIIRYSTEINAVNSTAQYFMATDTWNKLTKKEQEIISRVCATVPAPAQLGYNNSSLDKYYQLWTDAGVEVTRSTELTEEQRASFIDAVRPIWDKYQADLDPDFYNFWLEKCKAAWEKNGYTWTM